MELKHCKIFYFHLLFIYNWGMNPAKYMVETRSVLTIYRDCHKLIYRMVNDPTKAAAAHSLLRK